MNARALPVNSPRAWVMPLFGALAGGLGSAAWLGPLMVDPTRVEWLMRGDYALHFFGWHMYRTGPWTWPVGATPLLLWPIGSSVGLTDSIPAASMLLKPFDAVLPPFFQFIGPWLVLSFALQGFFGVLLLRLATTKPALQLLGAAILMLSPPLMFRVGHAALTSHWLLLASLWLALRADTGVPSRRIALWWGGICLLAAATQPYLLLMVIVLMTAAHARQVWCAPRRVASVLASGALALAASYVALWQSGSLMVRAEEGLTIGGFGAWSTNVLSFVMPTQGPTLFFPGWFGEANFEQYEGYAYLGAGTLLLAAVALAFRLRHVFSRDWWRGRAQHLPLGVGLMFLAVMALGPHVNAGTQTLFSYDASWWGPLRIFRTNGRMIWPVFYVTTVAVLFAITRFRHRTALALLSMAVALQAADVHGLARRMADAGTAGFRDPLENPFWTVVPPHYRQMVLVPPNICAYDHGVDHTALALRAGEFGMGINAGLAARYDVRRAEQYCEDLRQDFTLGRWSNEAMYILRPDLLSSIKARAGAALECTAVDGFGVCVTAETLARWHDGFDIARLRVPPIDEVLRFHEALNRTYREELGRSEQPADGPLDHRLEGLMLYLGYRLEGCDAAEAERRSLSRLAGQADRALCPTPSVDHALPPTDQTYAFLRHLGVVLSQAPSAVPRMSAVDAEGEAVWLQAYTRERRRGIQESEARERVLAQIRGAAR
jgi:hypothetical protein